MKTVSLALRNLTRNKRRNAILAVAIAFGFFVVTAIDGLTSGMVGNLENQITQLVGGNVVVQGLEWLNPDTPGGKVKLVNIVRDRDYVKNIVDELDVKYDYYSCKGNLSLENFYKTKLIKQTLLEYKNVWKWSALLLI